MTGIVAAEAVAGGLKLYFHDGDFFRTEIVEFSPFVLADKDAVIPGDPEIKSLDGEGFFCRQAFFSSLEEYEKLLPELKKLPGVIVFRDLLQQALSMLDLRFFEGMDFPSLRQLSFSLECDGDEKISRITAASAAGGKWEFSGEEAQIIIGFDQLIREYDPDLLIGFNCCRMDLPLLVKRAKKLKITLSCGRDGGSFSMRQSRYSAGEKQYSYQRFDLSGRQVVDMLHPVQFYDAVHRDLEEFELVFLKEYFGSPTIGYPMYCICTRI